jgi:hypothetical protein
MSTNDVDPPPIPKTEEWQPRESASETLKSAFLKRCQGVEAKIRLRAGLEREMNVDNYDSGLGVEEIIRDELRQLLPSRYSVKAGVVTDRDGKSAGDLDVVIFNDQWFPSVKAGATEESRRLLLPIDGVYAVCEVKQTLDLPILDEAMEKLVVCHRLHRSQTCAGRLVENREGSSCIHGLSNPLYSAVIATCLDDGVELDSVVERFFLVNKSLKRLEIVRALCVLGRGTVTWGYMDERQEVSPALFMMEDLYLPIIPVYHKMPGVESALYRLMVDLLLHLYNSVLAPEDIAPSYGPPTHSISVPKSPDIAIQPGAEWIEKLNHICSDDSHMSGELRGRRKTPGSSQEEPD